MGHTVPCQKLAPRVERPGQKAFFNLAANARWDGKDPVTFYGHRLVRASNIAFLNPHRIMRFAELIPVERQETQRVYTPREEVGDQDASQEQGASKGKVPRGTSKVNELAQQEELHAQALYVILPFCSKAALFGCCICDCLASVLF